MVSELILDPFSTVLNSFYNVLPGLSAFIVIIAAGLLVSWIIGTIIAGVLRGTGFDRWYHKINLDKTLGDIIPSRIVGAIIKLWVFITFFAAGTDILDLGPISSLLAQLASWLPNAITAFIIVLFGWVAANIIAVKIANRNVDSSKVFAIIVKIIILIFTIVIALSQIGIKVSLAENSILVILAGIMLGIALAIGKGFGPVIEKKSDKILRYVGINA